MKDIKVVFKNGNAPSGKTSGTAYMVGKARLEAWEKSGKFVMDVEMPSAKEVKKPSKKKASKEKK